MSLLTILRTIGKDLKDVGGWIDDGLKVITPIIQAVDPPIGIILQEVETILDGLTKSANIPVAPGVVPPVAITLTAAELQAIITAITTVKTVTSATITTSTNKSVRAVFKT
jgi:hypothetical protein